MIVAVDVIAPVIQRIVQFHVREFVPSPIDNFFVPDTSPSQNPVQVLYAVCQLFITPFVSRVIDQAYKRAVERLFAVIVFVAISLEVMELAAILSAVIKTFHPSHQNT